MLLGMQLPSDLHEHAEAVGLAAIAGLLGCLMRTIKGRKRIRWLSVFVETASSGFVGYLALHLCQALKLSESWTGVVVGLLGWAGAASSIALVERLVLRRLGVLNDVAPSSDTPSNSPGKAEN